MSGGNEKKHGHHRRSRFTRVCTCSTILVPRSTMWCSLEGVFHRPVMTLWRDCDLPVPIWNTVPLFHSFSRSISKREKNGRNPKKYRDRLISAAAQKRDQKRESERGQFFGRVFFPRPHFESCLSLNRPRDFLGKSLQEGIAI